MVMYVCVFVHARKENPQTSAVLPFLSVSFGSEPFFSNRCNSRLSLLPAAKHVLIGRSVLPRANMASVSSKIASNPGISEVCKCCNKVRHISRVVYTL
ncbi:hypothetical protein MtrunA17_Chr3g0138151 [Medicago truncatula]|uniref:Uncharacterized protein n=1 Tax=Medicago truncatula TaxID=3880 RepID=A0A396IY75_MEDTR|nr:hypothetical protein MtrunA17_Chr3g0138151 [Medicago truncatula]